MAEETPKQRRLRLAEEQAFRDSQIKRLPSLSGVAEDALRGANPGRFSKPFNRGVNNAIGKVMNPLRMGGLPLRNSAAAINSAQPAAVPPPQMMASVPPVPQLPQAPSATPVMQRQPGTIQPTPDVAPPRFAFNDAAEAPPGRVEQMLQKKLADRAALAVRNVSNIAAATQNGGSRGSLDEIIARQKYNNYARMNPDMARRFGPGGALAGPAPVAPEPDMSAPSALAKGGPGQVSELGRGLDPELAARIQAGFAERAARESRPGVLPQGEQARTRADEMRRLGIQRPTRQSQNDARLARSLARAKQVQEFMLSPQLQLIAASKALDPAAQAHANLQNAQADAYRRMGVQPEGGAGAAAHPAAAPPGAPLPPGAQAGVTYRPMTMREKLHEAMIRGEIQPQGVAGF